jgi:hypothetical protein
MRELEGRSYDEIALRMGASNGAVRQLMSRARTSIRDRLGTLVPIDLLLRWTPYAGPSRAVALAGSGALAAKESGAVLMWAAPVVAVAPAPGMTPAPRRRATPRPRCTTCRPSGPRVRSPA